jgi:hypothetical protein
LALERIDLTILIRHSRLEVTTREAAEVKPQLRIYDITPLLTVQQQNGRSEVDTTSLVDSIQISVRPDTWEQLGGPATIATQVIRSRCLLVVSAPTVVHLELDQLLNQMDRASARSAAASSRNSGDLNRGSSVSASSLIPQTKALPMFGGVF